MKTRVVIILLSIFLFNLFEAYAQEQCKVLKPEIADKYSGKCRKGLAHGKGLAEGKDRYEGDFKNGLPHGKGKYTWGSGEIYEGYWKEGKRDGEGKFWYKKDGVDSMKYALWRNDIYIKRIIPSPYRIIRSSSVTRYSVRRVKEGNRVLFQFKQNGGVNTSVYGLLFSPSSGNSYTLGSEQGYENIVFPFTCKVSYKTLNSLKTIPIDAEFIIEIKEPGEWEVILNN